MSELSDESRAQHAFGLLLNLIAIAVGLAVLVGWAAIALYYIGPIANPATRKLFSAIYSVVGLGIAVMCLGYSRRLLRRLFRC